MTGTAAILTELQRRGISAVVEGDTLVLKPKHALDNELLARVRERKLEIIRALAMRPTTCSPTCYEIEPGRWIHHLWNGCRTPAPEFRELIIPSRADCGCDGQACRRCWLCVEHCRCLPKEDCWHCRGKGRCVCTACWKSHAGEIAPCVVCNGAGKLAGRMQ